MYQHTISFRNAFRGIWTALTSQINIRLHFVSGSVVLFLAVYLHIPFSELLVLILAITLVMLAEMVNTAIEFLCNAVTLEHREYIKHAKDVSAGAVLLTAIFALLIGIIVFLPKLL